MAGLPFSSSIPRSSIVAVRLPPSPFRLPPSLCLRPAISAASRAAPAAHPRATPCLSSLPGRTPSVAPRAGTAPARPAPGNAKPMSASIIINTSDCLQMFQEPEGAELVQPQLRHLGVAGAAEHLGDQVFAAREAGLGAGNAAEDHDDRLQSFSRDLIVLGILVPAVGVFPLGSGPVLAAVVAMAAPLGILPRRSSAKSPVAGMLRSGRS